MLQYYIQYNEKANINYIYLLTLYSIAEYNSTTKRYDTITYKRFADIEEKTARVHRISVSTLIRIFKKQEYKPYISLDKMNKKITIHNDIKGCNKFIALSPKEADILIKSGDNLLARYYCYMKYYCGYSKSKKIDTTAKQFLTAIGLSTKSNNYLSILSSYNSLLAESGILQIEKYRDNNGHERNVYSLV